MRGIEAAFWGTLGKDAELKTSRNGNPYVNMGLAVITGEADDGKQVTTWVQVTCFGEAAQKIAARAKKGDRVYCEGTLTQTQWNDRSTGEVKRGLNVTAWKCERIGNIGRAREKRELGEAPAGAMPNAAGGRLPASYCAGPAEPRRRSSADGFDFDRGDPLPF
jgi:single-strand DNA-binding protein